MGSGSAGASGRLTQPRFDVQMRGVGLGAAVGPPAGPAPAPPPPPLPDDALDAAGGGGRNEVRGDTITCSSGAWPPIEGTTTRMETPRPPAAANTATNVAPKIAAARVKPTTYGA